MYCCQSPSQGDYYRKKELKEEGISKPVILLGTRNGDVLEAVVNQNFQGLRSVVETKQNPSSKVGITLTSLYDINDYNNKDASDDSDDSQEPDAGLESPREGGASKQISNFTLSFATYLQNHNGTTVAAATNSTSRYKRQQRVLYALHPYLQVMYTIGEDQHLYLWDIEKSKLLSVVNQGLMATAIKLSPNGEILAVGFINGTFVLLDAKMDTNNSSNKQGNRKEADKTFFSCLLYT